MLICPSPQNDTIPSQNLCRSRCHIGSSAVDPVVITRSSATSTAAAAAVDSSADDRVLPSPAAPTSSNSSSIQIQLKVPGGGHTAVTFPIITHGDINIEVNVSPAVPLAIAALTAGGTDLGSQETNS